MLCCRRECVVPVALIPGRHMPQRWTHVRMESKRNCGGPQDVDRTRPTAAGLRIWRILPRVTALIRGVVLLIIVTACAGPIEGLEQPDQDEPVTPIYLVSHGWHTGIVIKRAELPVSLLPERRDFPEAEYLEFGWGDREFYQTPAFSLALALKAAFMSSGSVLHVAGFGSEVTHYFPASEIVEFKLSRQGFERLVGYIHESFARAGPEALAPLGPGLYGESQFYRARGTFHLLNTCNTWAAKALAAAGYPLSPANMADGLMSQARRFGRPVLPPAER